MLYIGVDLGTSAVKLLLMDGEGKIHKIVSKEYPLYFPHPGWSEQKPEDWFAQTMEGIKELVGECEKSEVAGISFGGQMHGLVALDREDHVIRPAILWNDGRTGEETDYLNQTVGKDKLSGYTANIAFAGFTAPKILWMKKHEPENFEKMMVSLRPGMNKDRDEVIRKLIDTQYTRNDMDFHRGTFRVRGDVVEIFPANCGETAIRVEFFGDEIDRITEIDVLTGEIKNILEHISIFPASHYVVPQEQINRAIVAVEKELEERVKYFRGEDRLLEAQRIAERTNFDIEMLRETGFCSGIENYSRHLAGMPEGVPPQTLMDYFPEEFLIIVDESHITIPQVRGMYAGDQSRKSTLVDYGFRLPSAKDNRPLNFEEFESKIDQMLFVSATPNVYEKEHELLRAEQIIRPTGLLDPEIDVRPVEGQIDDLIGEVNREIGKKNKVLITTLTKKMAEDLTDYMREVGIRVKYLHSDIDTLERAEIIRDLRLDVFDVLVGINLLREGLDIPEITLVAILDADKEGFLRSETSLIQTIGRAARNSEGHVIMYADSITDSMRVAINETNRRRNIQQAYNKEHGITPATIRKSVRDLISISKKVAKEEYQFQKDPESMSKKELEKLVGEIQKKMQAAAAELNFEAAAELRDKMIELKKNLRDM